MPDHDPIDADLAQAKAILARGKAPDAETPPPEGLVPGAIADADTQAAYQLLERLVAAMEQVREDRRRLATRLRASALAVGPLPEDWQGSVWETVERLNVNITQLLADYSDTVRLYREQDALAARYYNRLHQLDEFP